MRKPDRPTSIGILRCAIYTRKSSDDGLEQEFNSLDAQREACEAFVKSQRHAGWVALPDMYDDGGLSGGTMERPALRRLLSDVKAGKVQIIVVYKVDRLTRSRPEACGWAATRRSATTSRTASWSSTKSRRRLSG
jgi:DNA invertase Pin-like site-specific DNA recombinase